MTTKDNMQIFEREIDLGHRERFEILMEQQLDFSNEDCFPPWVRDEFSQPGLLSQKVTEFLVRNSLICHEVFKGNSASDRICRVVYSDCYLGWGPIDAWISRSLGGRALFNRLPAVSQFLANYLKTFLDDPSFSSKLKIKDLGAGSGSYAFQTLGILRSLCLPIDFIDWECVDFSNEAIDFGSGRAKEDGLSGVVNFKKYNFMSSLSYPEKDDDRADLVILVGVLCGMDKNEAANCLKKIRPHAKESSESKLMAATLLVQSYKESPLQYQVLAKLGWHLKPKTLAEVEAIFHETGYRIESIHSERFDENGKEIPGEYAIVTAGLR